jgi:hypothetical protein
MRMEISMSLHVNRAAALAAAAISLLAAASALAQTCESPIPIACGADTGVVNTDLFNHEDTYSCTGTTMAGAEDVYVMNEPAGTEIFVTMLPATFPDEPPGPATTSCTSTSTSRLATGPTRSTPTATTATS